MGIYKKAQSLSQYLQNQTQETDLAVRLSRNPDTAEEIESLGKVAHALCEMRPGAHQLKAIENHARERFLTAAQNAMSQPVTSHTPYRGRSVWQRLTLLQRAGFALILVLFCLTSIGGGIVYASNASLPGDPLYAIKLAHEKAQRYFTSSTDKRILLEERFTKNRLFEVTSILDTGREVGVYFDGVLYDIQPDRWIVNYLVVQIPVPTPIDGQPTVGDYVEIWANTKPQQRLIASSVKVECGCVQGLVDAIEGNILTVDGTKIIANQHPPLDSILLVGDIVYVHTRSLPTGEIYALTITKDEDAYTETRRVILQGQIEDKNGTEWHVAGTKVLITPQTLIEGSFNIGDMVEVYTVRMLDGQLFAVEIEPLQERFEIPEHDDDGGSVETYPEPEQGEEPESYSDTPVVDDDDVGDTVQGQESDSEEIKSENSDDEDDATPDADSEHDGEDPDHPDSDEGDSTKTTDGENNDEENRDESTEYDEDEESDIDRRKDKDNSH